MCSIAKFSSRYLEKRLFGWLSKLVAISLWFCAVISVAANGFCALKRCGSSQEHSMSVILWFSRQCPIPRDVGLAVEIWTHRIFVQNFIGLSVQVATSSLQAFPMSASKQWAAPEVHRRSNMTRKSVSPTAVCQPLYFSPRIQTIVLSCFAKSLR